MKKSLLLIPFAALFLASCISQPGGSSVPSSSKESSKAPEESSVVPEESSDEPIEESSAIESSEIESSDEEEVVSSSIEAVEVGDWVLNSSHVRKSSDGYPAPYTVELETSTEAKVSLSLVDVMYGAGKIEGKEYIQMRKESGLIRSLTPMKGTLTFRQYEVYVSYNETDNTGYPDLYVFSDEGASLDELTPVAYQKEKDAQNVYTYTLEVDGYFAVVAHFKNAGLYESISFQAE